MTKQVKEHEDKFPVQKLKVIVQGVAVGTLHRTFWLTLAVLLHLAAILSTLIVFRSGHYPNRAMPRLTLEW